MNQDDQTPKPKPNLLVANCQLVDGVQLLEILFPKKSRPTLRWLRDQQEQRRVSFLKIGRLVFFNPLQVAEDWRDRFTVKAKKGDAK